MVEAPGLWPASEGTGWSHGPAGREVPLAEAACDVAVVPEDPRQWCARPGYLSRVAGEGSGELGDAAHGHAMMVATGEQRSASRRADGGHVEAVVGEPHLLHAGQGPGPDLATERLGPAEAGVIDEDEQHVGCTIGRLGARHHRPVADRLVHGAADRATERPVRDGQHGAVGLELAHGLREGVLESHVTGLVRLGDGPRPARRAGPARTTKRWSSSYMAMTAAVPGFMASPSLSWRPLFTLRSANLPTMPPAAAPTTVAARSGGAARPTRNPTAPPQPRPLRPRLSPGPLHADVAVPVVGDEDDRLDRDLPGLDPGDERLEVLASRSRRRGTQRPGRPSSPASSVSPSASSRRPAPSDAAGLRPMRPVCRQRWHRAAAMSSPDVVEAFADDVPRGPVSRCARPMRVGCASDDDPDTVPAPDRLRHRHRRCPGAALCRGLAGGRDRRRELRGRQRGAGSTSCATPWPCWSWPAGVTSRWRPGPRGRWYVPCARPPTRTVPTGLGYAELPAPAQRTKPRDGAALIVESARAAARRADAGDAGAADQRGRGAAARTGPAASAVAPGHDGRLLPLARQHGTHAGVERRRGPGGPGRRCWTAWRAGPGGGPEIPLRWPSAWTSPSAPS